MTFQRQKKDLETDMIPSAMDVVAFTIFLEKLLLVPEVDFFNYSLRRDPVYEKISFSCRDELILLANECGTFYAETEKRRSNDILTLFREEGIAFEKKEDANSEEYLLFAQYTEPNKIVLYNNCIENVIGLLKRTAYSNVITEDLLRNLILSHEYFHFLEHKYADEIVTKNKKIVLWKLFSFEYTTTLISLSEMSAMCFAKAFVGVEYSPFILDCLMTYPSNPKLANAILEDITGI